MNGFIRRTVALAGLAASLASLAGCTLYNNFVDPCYPQRYEWESRQPVYEAFGTQAANGHVLDQTIWNHYFEPGTDKLTTGGIVYLKHLAQRRPEPDPKVWLATAQDIGYDPAAPGKYAADRTALDGKRTQAVYNFLQAETAGRPVAFEVAVHNPALPSNLAVIYYRPPSYGMMPQHYAGYMGMMPVQGVGPGTTTGGPTGPSPR